MGREIILGTKSVMLGVQTKRNLGHPKLSFHIAKIFHLAVAKRKGLRRSPERDARIPPRLTPPQRSESGNFSNICKGRGVRL